MKRILFFLFIVCSIMIFVACDVGANMPDDNDSKAPQTQEDVMEDSNSDFEDQECEESVPEEEENPFTGGLVNGGNYEGD